jgi:hypothetical protein
MLWPVRCAIYALSGVARFWALGHAARHDIKTIIQEAVVGDFRYRLSLVLVADVFHRCGKSSSRRCRFDAFATIIFLYGRVTGQSAWGSTVLLLPN